MTLNISIVGAHGEHGIGELHVSGALSGTEGVALGKDQVKGIYHTPVDTEWARARQQRGGSMVGKEFPERDMQLGFKVRGGRSSEGDWQAVDNLLWNAFTYNLDPYWPADELAKIVAETDDSVRELRIQMYDEPEFAPDTNPDKLQYGNVFYKLRAAQPFWESEEDVSVFETAGTSGSMTDVVSNPTGVDMFQYWVLTPGKWTLPDISWTGPPGKRVPGGEFATRAIPLQPVTAAMRSVTIDLDPEHVMFQSADKQNVMGQVGGNYYFQHVIPSHTPPTLLTVSVTGAPAGGARAELHQPRLWHNLIGGELP